MNKLTKELVNGIKYVSCEYLSFGDYDNSCAVERANVRYLKEHDDLKDSIDNWSMGDFDRGDYLSTSIRSDNGFPTWQPIESDSKLIECYGGCGSIQLWLREDVWNEMELDQLEDYYIIDDDMVFQVEMDMENEAWESYIKSDLIRLLPDEYSQDQFDEQEVKCQNCNWEGKSIDLENDIDLAICPNCHNPYMLKFYPIEEKTLREFADELNNETLCEIYRYCCEKENEYGEVESGGNWYINLDKLKECFIDTIEHYMEGHMLCIQCNGYGQKWDHGGYRICELCNGSGFIINNNKETESEKEN